jgi:dienelactone hydrolase
MRIESAALFVVAWLGLAPACFAQAPLPGNTAASPSPPALDVDTREAIERVEVAVKDAYGKESKGALLVTTFRPQGNGPFPLVIINHGRASETRATYPRQRFEGAARYFVRKGFAVAAPLRFGYGELAELGDPEDANCFNSNTMPANYRPAGEAAARQVVAVAKHMQLQPDIDPSRLVVIGQSLGGFTAVATSAQQPAGLVAVINFAGGHGGNPRDRPGEPCQAFALERLFGQWGAKSKAPTLWVYTENDKYFGPQHTRRWHESFVKAGGQAELAMLPAFGDDGHGLFAAGLDVWQPLVDEFLAKHGFAVPGRITAPAASGFAKIDDVAAVPIRPQVRNTEYPKFLARQGPRAFAIGPDGRSGWASGDDAMSRALAFCQRRMSQPCRLYAVNNDVVWKP